LAQSAADRVGPITHDAAERLAPLAHSAADRIAPLTNQAIDRVSPYAQQAVSKVSPYAHQAAERIGPMASTAKQQGARVAHDALEKIAPVLDEALEKISPAVEAARGKVSDDILPKLSEVLSAAAGTPVVVEATKRGKAAVAAAKGELELPEKKKKSRWVMRIAVVAAIAGAAVFVIRRFLGSRDADWQAARPTTPYAPPRPAETSHSAESAATAAAPTVDGADAGDDPQGGLSAHLVNVEADGAAVPDQPAEGGDVEAPAEAITEIEESLFETSVGEETPTEAAPESEIAEPVMADVAEAAVEADPDAVSANEATEAVAAAMASPRYEGEGVYVGHEPPDGFTIKGNERSMKYHVPESSGYGRTIAEVWFNSEEAAQQAGFVRAHR
jgi:vacuolar-type H+-ATPase subunit E/Vma4